MAAVVAIVGVVASDVVDPRGLFGVGSSAAAAATPPLLVFDPVPGEASTALTSIADSIQGGTADAGVGPVAHIELREWNLHTRVDGETVRSAVVEQRSSTWTTADGRGRQHTSSVEGDVVLSEQGSSFSPGQWQHLWPLGSLSDDPAVLARQLGVGHPASNGPAERLVAVADVAREQPLHPAQRAALLRYLGATPGLHLDGVVTDRAGRTGLGVSVESSHSGLPTRYTMIVDQRTGAILAWEQMLTSRAGALDVRVPAVIGYTLLITADFQRTP